MGFPNDADGQVLARMVEHGFDLSKRVDIDFNIDFDHWPLSVEEMQLIRSVFPGAVAVDPSGSHAGTGYVLFRVHDQVTHDLVVRVQRQATELTQSIGGICESWGVLQE